jgi:hypothetical protein
MLRDQLIGALELISIETPSSDQRVDAPFGSAPKGLFLFDQSGYFSVQIASGDSTRAGAPDPRQHDEGYLAMWGRFEVEEESPSFVLSIVGSNRPGLIGTQLRRYVTLTGPMAEFRTDPDPRDGIESVTTIAWRRVSET